VRHDRGDEGVVVRPRDDRQTFGILFREFFTQLFISESAVSDHQVQVAMIGVVTLLIMPGLLIPLHLMTAFETAAKYFPLLLSPLTRLVATVFVTFAIVAVGVIAAYAWDSLTFDRRDALVLGPQPISARTIVAAKLAALGALFVIAGGGINLLSAFPLSLFAPAHQPITATIRLFIAHVVTTMTASAFVFCGLITVRAATNALGRGRVIAGTLFQCALVSALLCFIVFAPASLELEFQPSAPPQPIRLIGVHTQPIPAWMPTHWFVALYDVIRGATDVYAPRRALVTLVLTLASAVVAVAAVAASYRQQLRLALAPARTPPQSALARIPSFVARLFAGRDRSARGLAEFMVVTLLRNRQQQTMLAMNGALGVVMILIELTRRDSDAAGLFHPSIALARIPLLIAFWLAIGLRASFFVPSQLPAAWALRANILTGPRVNHSAIRAASITMLVPPVSALASVLAILSSGWKHALWHASFVALATLLLVEVIALTVPFVPFARPYQPGHAKLKTRWPIYAFGVYLFAYVLARVEQDYLSVELLTGFLAAGVVLDVAGEVRSRRMDAEPGVEWDADEGRIAVLDIGLVAHRSP